MIAQKVPILQAGKAPALEAIDMTKRFGAMTALDNVSVSIPSGSFHALLGENGAGKSTLVKCIMGFYRADEGTVLLNGREINISNPKDARANGIGMVYQHFTLVPSLTAAENLVINRADAPAVINWSAEKRRLEEFLDKMPFRVPLDTPISSLAAGEKQKLEILKLLYLDQRFMILDEPTSVLTPAEADEILGLLKRMALAKDITVVIITHKFREVTAFADAVDRAAARQADRRRQGRRADHAGHGAHDDRRHPDPRDRQAQGTTRTTRWCSICRASMPRTRRGCRPSTR